MVKSGSSDRLSLDPWMCSARERQETQTAGGLPKRTLEERRLELGLSWNYKPKNPRLKGFARRGVQEVSVTGWRNNRGVLVRRWVKCNDIQRQGVGMPNGKDLQESILRGSFVIYPNILSSKL